MRSLLKQLQELQKLKDIAAQQEGKINTSQLEQDFLRFSTYTAKKKLQVKLPKLYHIQGEEQKHLHNALIALELRTKNETTPLPKAIDIAGEFEYTPTKEVLLFLSPTQFQADHYSSVRSYLNPLVEKIYSEHLDILRDFTKHEAVIGIVKRTRGDVALEDIIFFPERFTSGPYELKVQLDTPTNMITTFSNLHATLRELNKNPQISLLQQKVIQETTAKAVDLRKIIGSLSRYKVPQSKECTTTTTSCIVRTQEQTLFHLYAENIHKNYVVTFGKNPFSTKNTPQNLEVLQGDHQVETLQALIQAGIYKPSLPLLQQHIVNLEQLYDAAKRNTTDEKEPHEFEDLIKKLKEVQIYFDVVINPDLRQKYLQKTEPELAQFMVCPASDDIVLYQLLPRLSWNESVRMYHQTLGFQKKFEQATDTQKKEILSKVISNITFDSQQNNDVNIWLYQNYQTFCEQENIEFEVI